MKSERHPASTDNEQHGATARAFLDTHKIAYKMARSSAVLSSVEIAAMARAFTVLVKCAK